MSKYILSFTIKQKPEDFIILPNPCIISNIELTTNNNELNGIIRLEANNDEDAIQWAKKQIDNLRNALVLCSRKGFDASEPQIKERRDEHAIGITVKGLFSSVTIQTEIPLTNLPKISKLIESLDKNLDENQYLKRALFWYNRGLFEYDPSDSFIDFYIAMEILGDKKSPKANPTKRVKNLIKNSKFNTELLELVKIRNKLFHSGILDSLDKYNRYMSEIIYIEMMNILE